MAELAEVEKTVLILKDKIEGAVRSNGVKDEIDRIDILLPPELKGEHFATETAYATVHFADSNITPKNLFVKKFSNNAMHTEMVKQMRVMEKEAAFFNSFLPELRKFAQKFLGCEGLLDFFPKCFYADENCVIMENLVLDNGFIMLDKEELQDFQTAKIVFTNLAKFHAANYAFIEDMGRETFRRKFDLNITESFDFSPESMMAPMFDNGIVTSIKILTDNPIDGSKETSEKLGQLLGKIVGQCADVLTRDEEMPLLVLNHGDCWNNNMLFKKDSETGLLVDHIFVDLQITRYGSPCLDLGYFFMTSVKPEVRVPHFEDLLRTYYDQFQSTAQSMGTNCPITFEQLVADFKYFCKLGYFMSISMASAIGAFKDIDMEDMGTNPEETMEKFNKIIHNWVASNPDKAKIISSNIISLVRDYECIQDK